MGDDSVWGLVGGDWVKSGIFVGFIMGVGGFGFAGSRISGMSVVDGKVVGGVGGAVCWAFWRSIFLKMRSSCPKKESSRVMSCGLSGLFAQ